MAFSPYAFSNMSIVFDFQKSNLHAKFDSRSLFITHFTRKALKTDVVYMSGVKNQHDVMNIMPKVRAFNTSRLVKLSEKLYERDAVFLYRLEFKIRKFGPE